MRTVYYCEDPGCARFNRDFPTAEECLAHEARKPPDKPLAKVGDIVLLGHCFGWFNGSKAWISNPNVGTRLEVKRPCPNGDSNCFENCCNYEFYWVVTAVDVFEHRWRYHVASRAVTSERRPKEPIHGWSTHDHYKPRLVPDPPQEVVESSKELLGLKYENLL